ncbi:hypothetical protein IWQ49_003757 [Labrenzia sp. EL_126]|nr:hypothetical protein [Labrenzia sp. EL_126]
MSGNWRDPQVIWAAATNGMDTLRGLTRSDAEEFLDNQRKFDDATFIGDQTAQLGL